MAEQDNPEHGWRPVPDPTVLTTQALLREIAALKELLVQSIQDAKVVRDEKFHNVDIRFIEMEKLRVQNVNSNNDAIAAALQAQKDSSAKTELVFTKQIDQLQILINTISRSTDEKIDDIKTRLDLGEGKGRGFSESWGIILAFGSLATAVLITIAHYLGK